MRDTLYYHIAHYGINNSFADGSVVLDPPGTESVKSQTGKYIVLH